MRTGPAVAAKDELPPEQQPIPRGVMQLAAGPQFDIVVAQWNRLPRALREHLTDAVEQRQLAAEPGGPWRLC